MTRTKKKAKKRSIARDQEAISRALGSARPVPMETSGFVPTTLLVLAHGFNERLRSTGGRPTDPSWTLTRRVPFSPATWEALNTIAMRLSNAERKVAPAHVAAALIEQGIAGLDEDDEETLPE